MDLAAHFRQLFSGEREPLDDIDAELEFHLEQLEREGAAGGLGSEEAREAALRRFGNMDKIRAECRRVQAGGTLMLQRITLLFVVLLVGIVVWLGYQNVLTQRLAEARIHAMQAEIVALMEHARREPASTGVVFPGNQMVMQSGALQWLQNGATAKPPELTEERTPTDTWVARFREAEVEGETGEDEALLLRKRCSADRKLELLAALWPKIGSPAKRTLLDILGADSNERLVRAAVDLGAMDPDDAIAARAFEILRELTFLRFDVANRGAYATWRDANREASLDEIVEQSAPALVRELAGLGMWNDVCALYAPLSLHTQLAYGSYAKQLLREAGAVQLIQAWARDENPRARVAAVQWTGAVGIDEVTARMIVMPILADGTERDPGLVPAVCEALVELECTWAWEPLLSELGHLMRRNRSDRAQMESLASALGRMDNQRVLPTILAWIVEAKSPLVEEVLGRGALESLTGVDYDATHDATWWLNWWSINRGEFPNAADTETGLPRVFTW